MSSGLPIVVAVHKNGGTRHHWIVLVGKDSSGRYLVVGPGAERLGFHGQQHKDHERPGVQLWAHRLLHHPLWIHFLCQNLKGEWFMALHKKRITATLRKRGAAMTVPEYRELIRRLDILHG